VKLLTVTPRDLDCIFCKSKPKPGAPPPAYVNPSLDPNLARRNYIHAPAGSSYRISDYPGMIAIKKDDTTFELGLVVVPFVKKGVQLKINDVSNSLYEYQFNDSASFNGSAYIASVNASKDHMVDLNIIDVSSCYLDKDDIDLDALKTFQQNFQKVKGIDLDRVYFILNSLLTVVNFKDFVKSDINANVNATFIKAAGSYFQSNSTTQQRRLVSIELIPINTLIGN